MNDMRRRELRRSFDMFDSDGGGSIDQGEFQLLMKALGLPLTDDEAEDLMNEVDLDSSGQIDFEEFVTVMTRQGASKETQIEDAWKALGGQCYSARGLDADEIEKGLKHCGIRVAHWEIRDMMCDADLDKDGKIDWEEFVNAYDLVSWKRANNLGENHCSGPSHLAPECAEPLTCR